MAKPNNTKALFNLLGWQGGTIHQVGEALGVNGLDLIYNEPTNGRGLNRDYMAGQFAHDTCTLEYTREVLLPKYKGNLDFFLGYMRAADIVEMMRKG